MKPSRGGCGSTSRGRIFARPRTAPRTSPPLALDLGCGPGALTLRLARAGWNVLAVDASAAMIELTGAAARREGLADKVETARFAAERTAELCDPFTFDSALCHNVLEYVSDPAAVVAAVARVVRAGGLVSLVARNRAGEAMRDAVRLHDLDSAESALTAESVRESLYGGPARLFDAGSLCALAARFGMRAVAVRGVRVVADYLPPSLSDTPEAYARLLAFEQRIGADPAFIPVARYTQVIARTAGGN
ncbi:MAG: class I SAM-dependent methyltransferase [Acidobacteria bacterium]|nr:class I SAM-dependent methyltransferase [Acidobacteriota bacterium]